MNNRRNFIKKSLMVATALMAAPLLAKDETPVAAQEATAGTATEVQARANFPVGIVYTKENPGKWEKKVSSHAPIAKVDGNKVTIQTAHPMSEEHYIVRHTLVTDKGEVLGEKTFTPKDEALSSFDVDTSKYGTLYATSFCNKHDFWVSTVATS